MSDRLFPKPGLKGVLIRLFYVYPILYCEEIKRLVKRERAFVEFERKVSGLRVGYPVYLTVKASPNDIMRAFHQANADALQLQSSSMGFNILLFKTDADAVQFKLTFPELWEE